MSDSSRRPKARFLVGAFAAVCALALTPGIANADPGAERITPTDQETTTKGEFVLTPGGAGADGMTGLVEGCYARSYVPAKNGSIITAPTDLDCLSLEPYLQINAYLRWSRWFGWESVASNVGSRTPGEYLDVDASWGCGGSGTHNFQTHAYFYVEFWNGTFDSEWVDSTSNPRYSC